MPQTCGNQPGRVHRNVAVFDAQLLCHIRIHADTIMTSPESIDNGRGRSPFAVFPEFLHED